MLLYSTVREKTWSESNSINDQQGTMANFNGDLKKKKFYVGSRCAGGIRLESFSVSRALIHASRSHYHCSIGVGGCN